MRKHEKTTDDSRVSITLYRTGRATPKDACGPTGFLLAGKERKTAYSERFLVSKGVAEGSRTYMTPNG